MPKQKKTTAARRDQPHDALFKVFFGDAKIARNYLLHYTPNEVHEEIDFTIFRKSETSFTSGRFGIAFSDLVYETRLKSGGMARLLFLFEHKSYVPSQPVHLQLLDYLLQIWEDDLKNGRAMSCVIPIVVYHGEQGWARRPLSDSFPGMPEIWKGFIPDFNYLLTDLSRIPVQVIRDKEETEYLRNLFWALKLARNEHLMFENWKNILNFGSPNEGEVRALILLQSLTLYIVNQLDMTDSKVKELSRELPDKELSWLDAIPDVLWDKFRREGRAAGHAEGRAEGRDEGRAIGQAELLLAFTQRTIQKFPEWTDWEVAEFVEATEDYVRQVRAELVKSNL